MIDKLIETKVGNSILLFDTGNFGGQSAIIKEDDERNI